jgi:hypothetical protein
VFLRAPASAITAKCLPAPRHVSRSTENRAHLRCWRGPVFAARGASSTTGETSGRGVPAHDRGRDTGADRAAVSKAVTKSVRDGVFA